MSAGPAAAPSTGPINPYVGPRAFGPGEHLPNRDHEANEVADLVVAERAVLMHSPSGAGKTSLIQAAVLPILEAGGFAPLGPVRVDKPVRHDGLRNRYVYSIAQYLLCEPGQDPRELHQLTLRQVLARAFPPLEDPDYAGRPPVLVIDQLEEALVLDPTDWPAKDAFFKELGAALRRERLWLLLAMREDYMGGLYRYLRHIPGHLRARYRLDFLTPDEALDAIQKPAAAQGVHISDEAARLLIAKLAHTHVQSPGEEVKRLPTPYVEPFQLQVACRRLWKEVRHVRGDHFPEIDETDVERVDVDQALSRYYAECVADVEERFGVPQRIVREWIESELITAQQFRGQTMSPPVPGPAGADVLRRLREAYLIRDDSRSGTTWYELTHDRLIAAVLTDNRLWRHKHLLSWQRAAYDWQRTNRQRDFLLDAAELRLAPAVGAPDLTGYEREFLRESEAGARREVSERMLVFNGVDAATGDYLTPSMPLGSLIRVVRGGRGDGGHLDELRRRRHDDEAHLGVMYGRDPNDLGSAGWGLVVPEDVDPGALEALAPLVRLREGQAGELYQRLMVRPGEGKDEFLRRYGMGPSPADPRRVPYYLLIVGGPEQVPFSFQYQLDVSYAVGRLDFDTPAEYAAYAAAVVAAEGPGAAVPERRVHLFAPRNPADTPTALSASRLALPLAEQLRELAAGWVVTEDVGDAATRRRLGELVAGPAAPAVLFTASHGVGDRGDEQREIQGALLCQDWPGPLARGAPVGEDMYLAGRHVATDEPVGPRVVFSFACFGGGTPDVGDFPDVDTGRRPVLADRPFTARLPQRLLANPAGGALAFVGHVDRAWSCSFLWKGIDAQVTPFASTLLALLDGVRLGCAMESLNSRYAEVATELTHRLDESRRYGRAVDEQALVGLWTANNDARSYVVLGDPAVRVGPAG